MAFLELKNVKMKINRHIWQLFLKNMWFQQDGATCHTTWANMALLQETFTGKVISRRGDINWPPRSFDLTPLDLFL